MKTKEQLHKDLEQAQKRRKYLSDQEKVLGREARELDRRQRTRRLVERGAILEKYLKKPLILSNEQVRELLGTAFSLTGTQIALEQIIAEAELRALPEEDGDDIA